MAVLEAFCGGLVGACALTTVHETARRTVPNAPRMDVLGMRAIAKPMRAAGVEPPPPGPLHTAALAGDLVANSLYYSLVGLGGPDNALLLGAMLGLAAGVGTVTLPGPMGLGRPPGERSPQTLAMTVAWYLIGGLAAAAAYRALASRDGR